MTRVMNSQTIEYHNQLVGKEDPDPYMGRAHAEDLEDGRFGLFAGRLKPDGDYVIYPKMPLVEVWILQIILARGGPVEPLRYAMRLLGLSVAIAEVRLGELSTRLRAPKSWVLEMLGIDAELPQLERMPLASAYALCKLSDREELTASALTMSSVEFASVARTRAREQEAQNQRD